MQLRLHFKTKPETPIQGCMLPRTYKAMRLVKHLIFPDFFSSPNTTQEEYELAQHFCCTSKSLTAAENFSISSASSSYQQRGRTKQMLLGNQPLH